MKCVSSCAPRVGERASAWLRLLLSAAALLEAGAVSAQALISPVVVEFGPKQRIATVRVTLSDAARPMRLQAQLLRWRQDLRGEAVTEPSTDLIVSPRIAELKPGQPQVLRIALRGALPTTTEMTYRLLLEDVAEPASAGLGGGASVNFRMAYDLPVLVPPKGPVSKELQWRPCPASAAPQKPAESICLRVLNTGNRRVKVQTLNLEGEGWQQQWSPKEPQNVLAGDEAEWHVPANAAAIGPLRALGIRTFEGETLQARPAAS